MREGKGREGETHAFCIVVRDEAVGVGARDPTFVVKVLEVREWAVVGERVFDRICEPESRAP